MTKPCPDDLAAFKHEPADYEQPVEAATVEQCDRDAAAALIVARPLVENPDIIIHGGADDGGFVQAFARHRTQANETMKAAASIVELLIDRWSEECYELMDAFEFPDLLVKHGLAEKTAYDPDVHGSSFNDVERGDPFYVFTDLGHSLRAIARAALSGDSA